MTTTTEDDLAYLVDSDDDEFPPPTSTAEKREGDDDEEERGGDSKTQTTKAVLEYQKHLVPSGDDSRKLVILVPQELATTGFDLVKLPHPKTGALQKYALSRGPKTATKALYELQKMQNRQGSWFVREHQDDASEESFELSDGYVISKGALLLASPVDPTFIALRSLVESSAKRKGEFLSYNDIITFDTAHSAELHTLLCDIDLLFDGINAVCDTFEIGGEMFYKYSENRAVEWLKVKAEAIKDVLKAPGCPLGYLAEAGSFSASYRRENGVHVTDATLTSAALGFLSEYVPQELLVAFANKAYGIADYKVSKCTGFAVAQPVSTNKNFQHGGYKRSYHQSSSSSSSDKMPQAKVNNQFITYIYNN